MAPTTGNPNHPKTAPSTAARMPGSGPATKPPTDPATVASNAKLADFAHAKGQRDKQDERDRAAMKKLPPLPKLPKAGRKAKPSQPCQCGCAEPTRGGRFLPGHDARLHAWCIRVERGLIKLNEVPAPHTEAVKAEVAERRKTGKSAQR